MKRNNMTKKKLAIVLGIRPDVIRASIVLEKLRAQNKHQIIFIWSGQHYDDNLKDIFFRDLNIAPPEMELGATGNTDAELVGSVISRLHPVLAEMQPEAGTMFQFKSKDGRPVSALIRSVEDDSVLVDMNHPLAGKTLHFKLTVNRIQ